VWIKRQVFTRVLLLAVILVLAGVTVFGCTPTGAQPKGWSGGTIADGALFFGSMEGQIVALNTSDGGHLWESTLEPPTSAGLLGCTPVSSIVAFYGTPAVAGGLVYIGGYNGKVYAFNSSSGELRWVYPREGKLGSIVGGPVVALGKVYIGGSDEKVYALNAATGDKEWEFQTGNKIWSTPAIDGETLYIGSFDRKLYALNAADGTEKWERPFETGGAIASTPLVYNNTVYFGSLDRHFYAVNAADGSLRWKFPGEKWFWARAVIFNNTVYAPCLDGKVYVLNAESGHEVVDAIDLGNPISSSPVLVNGSIIVATGEGRVFSIDTGINQKRQLVNVEELADEDLTVNSPLVAGEGIVYAHAQTKKHGSLLYALNAQTGLEEWHYWPQSSK